MRSFVCLLSLVVLIFSLILHCAIVQHVLVMALRHFRNGALQESANLVIGTFIFGAQAALAVYIWKKTIALDIVRIRYAHILPAVVIGFYALNTSFQMAGRMHVENLILQHLPGLLNERGFYMAAGFLALASAPLTVGLIVQYYENSACPNSRKN